MTGDLRYTLDLNKIFPNARDLSLRKTFITHSLPELSGETFCLSPEVCAGKEKKEEVQRDFELEKCPE